MLHSVIHYFNSAMAFARKTRSKRVKIIESQVDELLEVLREKRISTGYTQEQLAEILEISVVSLQAYENKRRTPSLNVFLGMCIELDCKIKLK